MFFGERAFGVSSGVYTDSSDYNFGCMVSAWIRVLLEVTDLISWITFGIVRPRDSVSICPSAMFFCDFFDFEKVGRDP